MRISDWSSDVCSSDLRRRIPPQHVAPALAPLLRSGRGVGVRARSSQEICHHLPSRNFSPSPDFPSPEQRRSLPVGVTQGQGMEIRQKKNSNKIRFVFGEEALDYSLEDSSRSEEHTSELQSLMRNSYAVFCLKKKNKKRIF